MSNFKNRTFNYKSARGFTILELVITIAIFAILLAGVLGAYSALTKSVKAAREKTILSSLATNYLEIVRNMPYSQVGTISGNPVGTLADFTNAMSQKIEAVTYKIYYEITYVDDPADGLVTGTGPSYDPAPADYKQVKMSILNTSTSQVTNFFTTVVPRGLEGTNNAGALLIKVFDANGNPLSDASVHITYPTTTPTLILDRETDANGQWIEVGLTAAVNDYRISVTKAGYSTDMTYPLTTANPNPTKPDATVVNGVVTQVSFFIDLLSNLTINTLNEFCQNISGVGLNISGAKLIGTVPSVYKYNNNFSSSGGAVALSSLEWDTYTPTLLTGQSVSIKGTSPIQKIDVLPGTSQTFTMILENSTTNSLLVIVKDSATGTALENATVRLSSGSPSFDETKITGGSVWVQSDWSGGGGQSDWSAVTPTFYAQDDGNIDVTTLPTGVRLKRTAGNYALSAWLESSTFDSGTSATNYSILSWQPTSQSASTTLSFQVAANNDNATWNYIGPDGTSGTYFSTPGVDIGSALDGRRYVRYKAYLSTTNNQQTPVLTSGYVNFVTGCNTPGQVSFSGLSAGNNYSLDISLAGYQAQNINSLNIGGNQTLEVLMSP